MAEQVQALPERFCIKTRYNNRHGYFLLRWVDAGLDHQNNQIHRLMPVAHNDRFFNIQAFIPPNLQYNSIIIRKSHGTVNRAMRWKYVSEQLRYQGHIISVLKVTPMSSCLPSITGFTFVPIRDDNPDVPTQPAVPMAPMAPIAPIEKQFVITSIPQHIVRSLLRDAAMQEEVCPITGEEIDVTNGAITTCFHLFEKNAILQWLLIPNSRDKCPVCNAPCKSYTLEA